MTKEENTMADSLPDTLSGRISPREINLICAACRGSHGDAMKLRLYSLVSGPDDRTAYNALWVFTHFQPNDMRWLQSRRNELIDILLSTAHTGKRRLILSILDSLGTTRDDIRTDYLDFCLSGINSTEPYGIRALCLKQSFAQCRFYPELVRELVSVIELMEHSRLSPGLLTARKNILKKISRL